MDGVRLGRTISEKRGGEREGLFKKIPSHRTWSKKENPLRGKKDSVNFCKLGKKKERKKKKKGLRAKKKKGEGIHFGGNRK